MKIKLRATLAVLAVAGLIAVPVAFNAAQGATSSATSYGCFKPDGTETPPLQLNAPICPAGSHWESWLTLSQPDATTTTQPVTTTTAATTTTRATTTTTGVTTTTQPTTHTCHPGDPLAGVVSPDRLTVTNPCQTVTGTVCQLEFGEADGDKAFDVIVDPQYTSLLRSTNVNQCAAVDNRLALHVETIPQSQASSGSPAWYSPVSETLALKVGEYVSVTGPLVQDTNHGNWTEIHPTEFVDVLPHP